MKKKTRITILLTTLLLLFAFAMPASAASTKSKALKAYKKLLAQKEITFVKSIDGTTTKESFPTSKMKFALVYLDNNTVPELVIDNLDNIPIMWYGEILFSDFGNAVFTYKGGKLKQLDVSSSNWRLTKVYKKKGVFYSNNTYHKKDATYYYIKGTKTIGIGSFENGKYYKRENGKYYKNGAIKPIKKSAFQKLLKKYVGSTKATKIKYYKNTAANRKKYLK